MYTALKDPNHDSAAPQRNRTCTPRALVAVEDEAAPVRLSRRRFLGVALPVTGIMLVACSTKGIPTAPDAPRQPVGERLVAWLAKDEWPAPLLRAAPDVQEAYRFAVANPDVLKYIPCYCGCVNDGHTSNKDCYIDEIRPDGSVVLDTMSFG